MHGIQKVLILKKSARSQISCTLVSLKLTLKAVLWSEPALTVLQTFRGVLEPSRTSMMEFF